MRGTASSETSVRYYRYSLRNNSEERNYHLLGRRKPANILENPSSRTAELFQADGQMDGHNEAKTVAFPQFCEGAEKLFSVPLYPSKFSSIPFIFTKILSQRQFTNKKISVSKTL